MINQINLADIRSFVLIAQQGNFTKAADLLGVSRSHVSRQISALEKQMSVTLLIRTTRTLRLTDAGIQFYQRCEKALHEMDQALLAAVDDNEEVKGNIRINCVGGYLGEEFIADLVCRFMQVHPNVQINLDFSSHRIDLIADQFDIAFRMGKLEDASFIARPLFNIEMVTLASPNYLHQASALAHPKDLVNHRCITGSVKKWRFQHCDDPNQITEVSVDGQLECKNGRTLVKGALSHNGIIRVPKLYCQQEIQQGKLITVLPQWQIADVEFSMLYHKDRYQPKRLREFILFVQQNLAR